MDENKKINKALEYLLAGPVNPEKVFMEPGVTYQEIYNLAGSIKAACVSMGEEEHLCLCTDNKAFIAAAVLASLAGGPSLAIPYSFSAPVLREMRQILTFTKVLPDRDSDLPEEMEKISTLPSERFSPLRLSRHIDSPFLKLFTGGSSGKPKLWSKTPVNIFSEVMHLAEKFSVTENDLFAATVPPRHIYGILFSVLLPLLSGASVLEEICSFPGEITRALEEKKTTVLISIPIHYRVLNGKTIKSNTLRLAFSSTAPLGKEEGEAFYRETGTGVVEVYGSTETGGIAVRNRAQGSESLIPLDPVEWKISGELLHVRSGFISPELPRDDEGYFITGDRCEYAGDTGFRLLGRADGIIKVAGKRVDLDEIREKIKNLPGVRDAVVLSIPLDRGREHEIVALVEGTSNEKDLRLSLSEKLEAYSLPRRIRITEKIPISKTGKYDRSKIEEFFVN